jgi:multidrug resistance efflux pump
MPLATRHPALRKDLVVSHQETPEGPCVVLKDPASRRFFRLGEREYFIARQLDGETPPELVRERVTAEDGEPVTPEELDGFVRQLERTGLLERGLSPATVTGPGRRRAGGSVLYLRLKAFDPDRLFERILPWTRFFFTPYFVTGSALLILWALWTLIDQRQEFTHDLVRLWRFQNIVLAWITILVVVLLHEFAHGLTCKQFGGKVHELGFLLIYLQPAFYCNISDAWLFPRKSRRLWVTFAGAYFELFLWGLATLVWRVSERQTWLSGLALLVVATSGIKAFFNWNPLIKLDGYYLLCDLLDAPNLRPRAFAYIGSRLRRLVGAALQDVAEPSARERRIYLGYGVVAGVFSYWLLTVVLLRFEQYLTWRYRGWGFVLFAGMFFATFRGPITRAFPRFRRAAAVPPSPSTATSPSGVPAVDAPPPSSNGKGRHHRAPLSRRGKLLGLAGIAAIALYVVPLPVTVGGEFQLLPSAGGEVRSEVQGTIEQVFVDEGDRVSTGQPIARISDREYRARARTLDAQIEEKRANLRLLRAGPRREEIEQARAAAAQAEQRRDYARRTLDRVGTLARLEGASRVELDSSQVQLAVTSREADAAGARLRELLAGSRPEEIAAVEQQIAQADGERRHVEEQLARLTVTAPHAGVIATPRLREQVGRYVNPGDLIAQVHAVEIVRAEIGVSERDLGVVQTGERAVLRLRAYPDRSFEGTVTRVAPAADSGDVAAGRVVRVRVDIPNAGGTLKPGLTGYARIYAGRRPALDVFTRRFRHFLRVEFWSLW